MNVLLFWSILVNNFLDLVKSLIFCDLLNVTIFCPRTEQLGIWDERQLWRKFGNRPFYSCVLSVLAWIESEPGVDLVLIETSLLFLCKCKLVSIRTAWFTHEKQWGFYQNKVNPSLAHNPRTGHWRHNCKIVYCKHLISLTSKSRVWNFKPHFIQPKQASPTA